MILMRRWLRKFGSRVACAVAVVAALAMALNVYAATSYQVNYTLSQLINEWGVCKQVQNNNNGGPALFIPTGSSNEWSSFRSFAQFVGLSECYTYSWQTGGWGGCSSACNGTQSRSVWCQRSDGASVADGFCGGAKPGGTQSCNVGSASYGQACNPSNSCGQTNSGTIQCDGSCSVGAPDLPPGYGGGCSSSANNCGQTNAGAVQCDGSCSAGAPADVPDRYVCSDWFCVNSNEVCDTCYDGSNVYECNCSYECVDYDRNCGYESGC